MVCELFSVYVFFFPVCLRALGYESSVFSCVSKTRFYVNFSAQDSCVIQNIDLDPSPLCHRPVF